MAVLAVHQEVTAVVAVVDEEVANVVAADEVVLTEPIQVLNALNSNLSAEKDTSTADPNEYLLFFEIRPSNFKISRFRLL